VITPFELLPIPAGRVTLRDARRNEVRDVELTGFRLADSPVLAAGADRPGASVTWFEAVALCNRLSDEHGIERAYTIQGRRATWDVASDGFRLPTEAEWEHACRAGTTGPHHAALRDIAWTALDAVDAPQPPRRKQPNALGLHDMLGNVWEWCWDRLDPARYGDYRVLRGGSWADRPWSVRASVRRGSAPDAMVEGTGIRLARGAVGVSGELAAQGWSEQRDRERADVRGPLPIGWTPLREP
jgi:formylglycine-generating enzyme required for sulfatase activity